jgi:hypothetical protein
MTNHASRQQLIIHKHLPGDPGEAIQILTIAHQARSNLKPNLLVKLISNKSYQPLIPYLAIEARQWYSALPPGFQKPFCLALEPGNIKWHFTWFSNYKLYYFCLTPPYVVVNLVSVLRQSTGRGEAGRVPKA